MDHEITPETCLSLAVEAAGTLVQVGHTVRPDLAPTDAGKWLARCLSEDHAQRLNYGQERLLYRLACKQGEHEGFRAYAESIGYRIEPIDRDGELMAMANRAAAMAERANELSLEVQARMKAAGLNLEAGAS